MNKAVNQLTIHRVESAASESDSRRNLPTQSPQPNWPGSAESITSVQDPDFDVWEHYGICQ